MVKSYLMSSVDHWKVVLVASVRSPVTNRTVILGAMLSSLIERGRYSRNRQAILGSVGISAQALSQYTRDQTRPSFQKLTALADFFGVSLDHLVYGEPASREGLIQQNEAIRTQRYCRHVDIATLHLGFDVIQMSDGDGTPAGQFVQVVAANIAEGCRYRFLLPGHDDSEEDDVAAFRRLLTDMVGGDRAHEFCHFRRSSQPMLAGTGLYRLDTVAFEREEPALFTQLARYLSEDGWLGYVIRPNDDSHADMVMSISHTHLARQAFDGLWSTGTPL